MKQKPKKETEPVALVYAKDRRAWRRWLTDNHTSSSSPRRKPKSPWSTINKTRVERLIAENRMTAAGLAKVEAAKKDGSWSSYDGVDTLSVPKDLTSAFATNAAAKKYFAEFPPSSRKIILWWIACAKRPETRSKRITETVRLAAKNVRANHWR